MSADVHSSGACLYNSFAAINTPSSQLSTGLSQFRDENEVPVRRDI